MLNSESYFLYFIIIVAFTSLIPNCVSENVKKSVDDNDNGAGDGSDESLDIATETESNNITCTRRQNSQMHEIRSARPKQFPFMAAIMSQQNEYLCSGVVVSNGLILTTGQCTQQPLSYVLLNTTTDKKDETTVSLHVIKTIKFPTFSGAASLVSGYKDVGLIYTQKHNNTIATKIKLSNFSNPRNIIDMEGIGFGLNTVKGQTRELQYVGIENRYPLYETADLLLGYYDCVETKVPICFKDTGGPVIFDNELIGIVIKGQDECAKEISTTYAVNKKMVDVLPTYTFKTWLDEKIKKNEEKEPVALATYPSKPARVGPKSAPSNQKLKVTSFQTRITSIPYYFIASLCTLVSF